MDAKKKTKPRIMGALLSAASHLVDTFLSASSGSLRFQPLLEILYDGFHYSHSTTLINGLILCVDEVVAALSFSATLLRVGVLIGRTHSRFESQLFKISPLISRLYAVNDLYRMPVVSLFEALIVSASKDSAEPPSLLGSLGTQTSQDFLQVLSDLDKPLRRQYCTTAIWKFLAMIVSSRQPWFANFLLTGRISKTISKNKEHRKDSAVLDRPLLNTALEALSHIHALFKPDALAMLDFVALAQNFWPWAIYDSAKYGAFIQSISEYVGTLKPIQPSSKVCSLSLSHTQNRSICKLKFISWTIRSMLAIKLESLRILPKY
jgi:nuclear pore complex protein Nup188